jgi:hypothetical protein
MMPQIVPNMPDENKTPPVAVDPLKNFLLPGEFLVEREELMKHQRVESGEACRDLGFEQALTDWLINHRSEWRKRRQTELAV